MLLRLSNQNPTSTTLPSVCFAFSHPLPPLQGHENILISPLPYEWGEETLGFSRSSLCRWTELQVCDVEEKNDRSDFFFLPWISGELTHISLPLSWQLNVSYRDKGNNMLRGRYRPVDWPHSSCASVNQELRSQNSACFLASAHLATCCLERVGYRHRVQKDTEAQNPLQRIVHESRQTPEVWTFAAFDFCSV